MLNFFINMLAVVKCYGDFGCFNNGGKFERSVYRPVNVLPQSPEVVNVSFLLYTRNNSEEYQVLSFRNDSSFLTSQFEANRSSKVIIHGYREDGFSKLWIKKLVKELLIKSDFNVFVVDWGNGAASPYTEAVANTRLVGAILAKLLEILRDVHNADLETFHLIGHSLGAHVAGYAGERLHRLGRITGLDPAKPYFENTDPIVRLDPTDALFVDVIHTDTAPFYKGGLGMKQPCGHVDFYPNGGVRQPGCSSDIIENIYKKDRDFITGVKYLLGCRHVRAYELFTDSVNSECPFQAVECSSYKDFRRGKCPHCGRRGEKCAFMGINAESFRRHNRPPSVILFLTTGDSAPYCRYHQLITVHVASNPNGDNTLYHGTLYTRLTGNGWQSKRVRLNDGSGSVVTFSPNQSLSYVVGTETTDKVTSVRLKWREESQLGLRIPNPISYFLGNLPAIWIKKITVESLENKDRSLRCFTNKLKVIPQDKTKVFQKSTACTKKGSGCHSPVCKRRLLKRLHG